MNTYQNNSVCTRCGDEIMQDEMLITEEKLCVFCDHMRSEAKQIQADRLVVVESGLPWVVAVCSLSKAANHAH